MAELWQEEVGGTSAHSTMARRFVEDMAKGSEPFLLCGEQGIGKEFLARKTHLESSRRRQPFVAIDCSMYYERELKREIFGYRGIGKAAKSRRGLFTFAAQGTCYLSRVEEIGVSLQSCLLEFLETGRFRRLGDGREVSSNVRLIVSTEKNLAGFVEGGLFLPELYLRLSRNVFVLPPLRERSEDVEAVAQQLSESPQQKDGGSVAPRFSHEAIEALKCYPWPRNYDDLYRELRRVLEGGHKAVGVEHLSLEISSYWLGRRGDPEVTKVLDELEAFMQEFAVLSSLDVEFGDVFLHVTGNGPLPPPAWGNRREDEI
jgi:transcriptional regulator of aroF, aroG, tyrA and aromatic amino acid transport